MQNPNYFLLFNSNRCANGTCSSGTCSNGTCTFQPQAAAMSSIASPDIISGVTMPIATPELTYEATPGVQAVAPRMLFQ